MTVFRLGIVMRGCARMALAVAARGGEHEAREAAATGTAVKDRDRSPAIARRRGCRARPSPFKAPAPGTDAAKGRIPAEGASDRDGAARSSGRAFLALRRGAAVLLLTGAALLTAFEATQAQPTTVALVGNLTYDTGGIRNQAGDLELVQGFSTGSIGGGYVVESIDIEFAEINGATPYDVSNLSVTLSEANTDNRPGTLITGLTIPSFVPNMALRNVVKEFSAPPDTVLKANTSYFVKVYFGDSVGTFFVAATGKDEDPGHAPGWAILDFSLDRKNTVDDWNQFDRVTFKIRVNGYALDTSLSALTMKEVDDDSDIALTVVPATDMSPEAYTAVVGHDVRAVKLEATLNDSLSTAGYTRVGATFDDGLSDTERRAFLLRDGENVFNVTVTSTGGLSTTTYPVTVFRRGRLTGSFADLPDSHDGSTPFTVTLQFPEDIDSPLTNIAEAIEVENGTMTNLAAVGTSAQNFQMTITPSSAGPVRISVRGSGDCDESHAICSAGAHFSDGISRWVSTADDARLRALWLAFPAGCCVAGAPEFDPDTVAYTAQVPESLGRVIVVAAPYTPGRRWCSPARPWRAAPSAGTAARRGRSGCPTALRG